MVSGTCVVDQAQERFTLESRAMGASKQRNEGVKRDETRGQRKE